MSRETDLERARRIVRAVFFEDLKGDVGHLARCAVPQADKDDIVKRLVREFQVVRTDERTCAEA